MIEYKEVSLAEIPGLIKISLDIFDPVDGDKNSHHQIQKWKQHLDEGGIVLGLYVDGKLVGYNFGYPYSPDEWHYWMGGILEEYRGNGYGRSLLEKQEEFARNKGYTSVSVNTYEHMWPVQFSFLQRHGYKVYKTEDQVWDDGQKVVKSFLRKEL